MRNTISSGLLIAATLSLVACGSTTAIVRSAVLTGAKIFSGVIGSAPERDALCKYYGEHRTEIEMVREYYKANWQNVPEVDKPALVKLSEQLNACDANAAVATPAIEKTTARALLDAFERAVAIYRELKAAGVL
jgi:hypothetical protein